MDAQGRLYFCSKGHAGFGGFDIFYSEEGSDGQWSNPINLGRPINSPFDDISIHLQDDGLGGMFTSSRSGGDDDIFLFKHLDKSEAVAAEIPVKTAAPLVAEEPRTAAPLVAEEPRMAEEQPIAPAPETETPPVEKPVEDVSEVLEVSAQPMQEVGSKEPVQELPPVPPLAQEEMPVQAPIHQEEMPIITEEVKANNVGDNAELPPFTPLPEKEGETFFYEKETEGSPIAPFLDLTKKLEEGNLVAGTRFRLDGATYDPLVWQLTPRVTVMLDRLVAQMKIYPSLQIEISAHTESLGVDEDNLRLSQNRVETVLEYMVREGIDGQRIIAKGCGESMPLNHCRNGVNCSMAEYLINQRLEVKVLALDGKW